MGRLICIFPICNIKGVPLGLADSEKNTFGKMSLQLRGIMQSFVMLLLFNLFLFDNTATCIKFWLMAVKNLGRLLKIRQLREGFTSLS